jgi:hypothetical protein
VVMEVGSMVMCLCTARLFIMIAEPMVVLLESKELAETRLPKALFVVRVPDTKTLLELMLVEFVVPETMIDDELMFVLIKLLMLEETAVIVLVETADVTTLGVDTLTEKAPVLEVRATVERLFRTRREDEVEFVATKLAMEAILDTAMVPVLTLVADVVESTLVPFTFKDPSVVCPDTRAPIDALVVHTILVDKRFGMVPVEDVVRVFEETPWETKTFAVVT